MGETVKTGLLKEFFGYNLKPASGCCNANIGFRQSMQDMVKRFFLWNIDTAFRYFPVRQYLKKNNNPRPLVLDIGSGSLGLSCYYPAPVFGLDIDFSGPKLSSLIRVFGSALEIPFRNGVFDLVVSLDVLEHLPPANRKRSISEIVRVSRRAIIIGFPCGKESSQFDYKYNELFKQRMGRDHPYSAEHLKYGLPDYNEIEEDLISILNQGGNNYSIKEIDNFNLRLWYRIHKFITGRNILIYFLKNQLLLLLFPLLRRIRGKSFYRKIIIVEKITPK